MPRSLLVVFDFDHTICEDNTDVIAAKLLPTSKLPKSADFHDSGTWTTFMAEVFRLLHENKISSNELKSTIENLPPAPGMKTLLIELHALNCEIIIISDSNSVFIESWLEHHNLRHTVKEIFTNPARFNEDGMLEIEMYHVQDWCSLSEKNMCKGYILDDYVRKRLEGGVEFDNCIYVGDGRNDLCPILRLGSKDLACPRIGYSLMKILDDPKNENAQKRKCGIKPWESGVEILEELKKDFL